MKEISPIDDSKINFRYISIDSHCCESDPYLVIASTIIHGPEKKKFLKYGVAFRSPKDKFDKKRGRELAISRLQSSTPCDYSGIVLIENIEKTEKTNLILTELVLSDIFVKQKYPHRKIFHKIIFRLY